MENSVSLDGHARRSLETRRKLLASAREAFSDLGYHKASTPAIAKAAGVSRGALYHQYPDKEALFRDVVKTMQDGIMERIMETALAASGPVEGLIEGAIVYVEAAATPEYLRIVMTEGPAVLGVADLRAMDLINGVQSLIDGLEAAREAGEIRDMPTWAMAHLLSGALDEAVFVVAAAEDREAALAQMGKAIKVLFSGLRQS